MTISSSHPQMVQFSSVQFSRSVVSDSLRPHELQHARPPCPSPTPGVHSDSRPSSQWHHPAISSSVVPFSSCPKSLPASVFSNESTPCMRWPKYWSLVRTHKNTQERRVGVWLGDFPSPDWEFWNSRSFSDHWVYLQMSMRQMPCSSL